MRLSGCGWHDARIRYAIDTRPRSHRWETYCQIVPVHTSKIAKSLICLGFFQNISKSHEHLQSNRINHLHTHAIRVHERESMTEAKHTPGPWIVQSKLSGSENHRGFRIMDAPNAWALADVQPGDSDGDLGRANARLIAAAPDLLAALARIAELDPATDSEEGFNEWGEADCFGQAKKIARAAIAAATGAAALKEQA